MKTPTGINVLGILYILGGVGIIFLAIIALIASNSVNLPFVSMTSYIFGEFFALVLGIVAIIQFTIASALFSRKNWGRTLVIIFVIIDLMFAIILLFTGYGFGIISMIVDSIVIYYMWRPHVIAYFEGVNVQPAQQYYNPGFSQNPPPYVPPSARFNNQYPGSPNMPPNPYPVNDETEIYPEDSVIEPNIPPQKICQKCQTDVSPDAKFCGKCGKWI